ncbi:MAG: hypothetical protein KF726_09100 [Anaerolineae bacterium]|nr:hypothetical protein [Anaerolineae bacterium]
MERQALIELFSDLVNQGIAQGEDRGKVSYEQLRGQIPEENVALLEHLYENYQQAYQPTEFVTRQVEDVDAQFEEWYELQRVTFDPSVLSPRENYVQGVRHRSTTGTPRTAVRLCRSFRVSGAHHYDADGKLVKFQFDPLAVVESAVCIISGGYIDLRSVGRPQDASAGIGHMATRVHFRRKGHAQAVTRQFEEEIAAIAEANGQTLKVILLEAEPGSRPFWASCGYRYPAGSRYYQPPIDFNLDTGERLFDEVPELLMGKVFATTSAESIDKALLMDAVKALYQRWYGGEGNNPEATQKIQDYVFGKLFEDFASSLSSEDSRIPLVMPPLV